jgi:predicted PhzF superfamily epimerase YddE/YHI9
VIEQGLEIKRPSFLHIRASKNGEQVKNVRVGGNVVHVIDGTVTL